MDIRTADLADLGRLIAGRTAYTDAAAIAQSTAPQMRFDNVVAVIVADPERRGQFTADELAALVGRMTDDDKRAAARERLALAGLAICERCGEPLPAGAQPDVEFDDLLCAVCALVRTSFIVGDGGEFVVDGYDGEQDHVYIEVTAHSHSCTLAHRDIEALRDYLSNWLEVRRRTQKDG